MGGEAGVDRGYISAVGFGHGVRLQNITIWRIISYILIQALIDPLGKKGVVGYLLKPACLRKLTLKTQQLVHNIRARRKLLISL